MRSTFDKCSTNENKTQFPFDHMNNVTHLAVRQPLDLHLIRRPVAIQIQKAAGHRFYPCWSVDRRKWPPRCRRTYCTHTADTSPQRGPSHTVMQRNILYPPKKIYILGHRYPRYAPPNEDISQSNTTRARGFHTQSVSLVLRNRRYIKANSETLGEQLKLWISTHHKPTHFLPAFPPRPPSPVEATVMETARG